LIIVESSFNDAPSGLTNTEPGVLRLRIGTYDNGAGQIEATSWDAKKLLVPTKDTGDTGFELGYFSTYDSATDTVYFFAPGRAEEIPSFQMDVYALDLNTGITTSHMNVDASVSLFTGGTNKPFGDKAVAFTLAPAGVAGDYNNNGTVDAADYVLWRNGGPLANDPTAGVQPADYDFWKSRFGAISGSGAGLNGGAVPEPASIVLVLMGLAFFGSRRRAG
jgi:hypothetical protein